jgi:7,8-dihydropterin-6-yl-methyl-4-(beta-D-ribofuranosyl)aminobenzene 5'-phosphate synthase
MRYTVNLSPISMINITILMDNITDRLLSNPYPFVKRAPMIANEKILPSPMAEHGFSALLEVASTTNKESSDNEKEVKNEKAKTRKKKNNNKKTKYLFDTGVSENGVIYNADVFRVDLRDIEAIILSHGHFDHITGLRSVLRRISKKPTKVICHPDAFLRRWIVFPDGNRAALPFLEEESLVNQGAIFRKIRKPIILSDNKDDNTSDNDDIPDGDNSHNTMTTASPTSSSPSLLITGQIPRITTFEKGFPIQYKEDPTNNKNLIPDPMVYDDQAIIANIKQKGLVIITGCGHAGIINTIRYATSLTGINKIHAVIGGFHLTGGMYEDIIGQTIDELQNADLQYLVPCHCTGWKATNKIIETIPEKFIQTSVSTTFEFSS